MTQLAVNPFATRYVRPGQLAWIGSGTDALDRLASKFSQSMNSRAAIIGPHGSGKSTLLAHLVPLLGKVEHYEPADPASVVTTAAQLSRSPQLPTRPVIWLALRRKKFPPSVGTVQISTASKSPLKQIWASRKYWQRGGLLVLDGFEQLPLAMQWYTILHTRVRSMGLLVTAHHDVALKTLLRTEISLDLAREVVVQVFQNQGRAAPQEFLAEPFLQSLLAEERGNLREVLMRLYDIAASDLPS